MDSMGSMNPEEKLIVALDVETEAKALAAVEKLYPTVKIFKVGSQLFTAAGPQIVEKIHSLGGRVFLDLKFHDIPNTVGKVSEVAVDLGVFMFNVHASGGEEMMKQAMISAEARARAVGKPRPLIIAVTVLTSFDDASWKRALGGKRSASEQVEYLAGQAWAAGLDGVVASAQEIALIRKTCSEKFLIVTPGIRPAFAQANDQKRTMTPSEAIRAGANYLVVGRPILAAPNLLDAAKKVLDEIQI